MKGILLIIVLFFVVWDAVWWALGVKPLFPWQLKKKLASASSDLLLLDVRTPMEFGWFHFDFLEDRLKERGGIYSKAAKWVPYAQVDGKLVTGQNPASSAPAAAELLKLLRSV